MTLRWKRKDNSRVVFMSGTETLVPYLKNKKKRDEEPTIIVDSREASSASKIVKGLVERGVNVKTAPLEKGDYVVSDQCAVERKTVTDFVYTLTRRHLFDQIFTGMRNEHIINILDGIQANLQLP